MSLRREKRWLECRDLEMGSEKTEFLLVTDGKSSRYPKIVLCEHRVAWSRSIKYLKVQLDRRLTFGEHLQIATNKAVQCEANLGPNIGDSKEAKIRLVASVVHSELLYTAPVWASALINMLSKKDCPWHREVQR